MTINHANSDLPALSLSLLPIGVNSLILFGFAFGVQLDRHQPHPWKADHRMMVIYL